MTKSSVKLQKKCKKFEPVTLYGCFTVCIHLMASMKHLLQTISFHDDDDDDNVRQQVWFRFANRQCNYLDDAFSSIKINTSTYKKCNCKNLMIFCRIEKKEKIWIFLIYSFN